MMDLVLLYGWTLVAGAVAAPALALLGAQLATRDRSLQTLCVSQGSMLGVLVGLGVLPWLERLPAVGPAVPFAFALAAAAATYLGTERLVAERMASRNTTFAFVFSLLLASGYLVSAVFPALESHMTQIYFGDLATLPTSAAQLCVAGFGAALLLLVRHGRALANGSFEWAIFGEPISSRGERLFRVLALAMLCLSVQYLGFLFTVTMLFLPTAMMRGLRGGGVRRHLALAALLASAGTVAGFLLSLELTRLPTVPTIAWVLFLHALGVIGAERALPVRRTRRRSAPVPGSGVEPLGSSH